jgi:hypothetical protein
VTRLEDTLEVNEFGSFLFHLFGRECSAVLKLLDSGTWTFWVGVPALSPGYISTVYLSQMAMVRINE